jgi:hypothetical protein
MSQWGYSAMTSGWESSRPDVLFEHGHLGKPVPTFPDHARLLFLSMILSENRFPLLRIMLGFFF